MQISRPGDDAVPPGPFRDLVDRLHDLYLLAGGPSARTISSAIFKNRLLEAVSHETYRAALKGTYLLSWPKYLSIVAELNRRTPRPRAEPEILTEFQTLWTLAQQDYRTLRSGRGLPSPPRAENGSRPVRQLPDRNTWFTGRRAALIRLRNAFDQHPTATVVLHGVNGTGKTQLAAEYAYRYPDDYPVTWWIRCASADQARADLTDLATELGLADGDRSLGALKAYLSSPNLPYLLIFDGVEDRQVRGLIPNGGGHVLVTTTDRELAYDTSMIEVEVLDFGPDEAAEFLERRLPESTDSERTEIIELAGRLPLALDIAARIDLETLRDSHAPSGPLVGTVRAVREILSPDHRRILDLFGWFGAAPVPMALLQRDGTVKGRVGEILANPIELRIALRELANYGLVRLGAHQVEMTSPARQALVEIIPAGDAEVAWHHVHEILARTRLGPPGSALAQGYRDIDAHLQPARLVESDNPNAQHLIIDQIRFRALDGDLAGAADLARSAVEQWQRPGSLGPDHELVLRARVELAAALRGLGAYAEARSLASAAVRQLQTSAAYGADHELTLAAEVGAALDLLMMGRYTRAVDAQQQAYERSVAALGSAHPRTVDCRRNLAASLRHAGQYAQAADLDQHDFDRLAASDDAIDAVRVAFALADDLTGLGRFEPALDLLDQYTAKGTRLIGDHDPGVLAAVRTAAMVRRRLGRPGALDELAALHLRCGDLLDQAAPQMLAVTLSYANALREAGRTSRAEQLIIDAISAYERRLSDRHPLAVVARVNLAAVHRAQGQWPIARQLGQRAAEQLRRTLGADHPYAIVAAVNHATDLALTGDRAGAVAASRSAYAVADRVLGPEHPDTLAAGTNLALDLVAVGSADEPLRESMLAGWTKLFGEHELVARFARGNRVECDLDPWPM
ncbi:FxSxx-COOH system tetratricopeptide repeat protein [Hamadaea sp. NPDC051192]|uniref:FxSxx-COOH system tetratricopeptide repeat protein n=1 Tax=Hamadaea sp. NPDC051192 TaxID=3154940 RepID=UPI00341716B0